MSDSIRPSFLDLVLTELESATAKFGPISSPHEGYAVIQEELDEFWELVKGRQAMGKLALVELVQVAAMAYRTAIDEGLAK